MRLWKRLQAALVRLGIAGIIIAFIAGIIAAAYFAAAFPDWTGFAADPIPPNTAVTPIVVYQPAKTLWDWLQLLLVPLVIAVGGYLFTRVENSQVRKIEEQRIEEARKLEIDRAQDAALQAYLDQMTQLLLHEELRTSQPDDEVRSVARARTLTVLRVLDGIRKATVVQFLYEARLIGGIKQEAGGVSGTIDAIVSLDGAKLEGAHLERANLDGADLGGAHLEGAHLEGVYLIEANLNTARLEGAHLEGAHLEGAQLVEADLSNCEITREQLAYVRSLEGAILPFDMAPLPEPEVEVAAQKDQVAAPIHKQK